MSSMSTSFALPTFTSPIVGNPSVEIIYQNHLETASERTSFLANKLAPYTQTADLTNRDIQALSVKIKTLSPQDDQQQIINLSEEMTQKMGKLITMMPVLNRALSIDEDFKQIDTILHQTDALSPEQQQVIDRIASLCSSIEKSCEERPNQFF